MAAPGPWRDAVLRAGDRYALASSGDGSPAQGAPAGGAAAPAVLRPRRPALPALAIDAPTAALYARFARAPARAGPLAPAEEAAIEGLILDGALELRAGAEFLTGAAAYAWMAPRAVVFGSDRVARLSRDAVAHAQALATAERGALARGLYLHGRLPLSPAWRRRLPSPAAVARLLGIGPGGRNRSLLDAHGRCGTDAWWLRWRAKGDGADAVHRHKLYVSPAPAHLPEAFSRTVRVLVASGTPRFKVARGAEGVLRPDKLVAYFSDAEHAASVARLLIGELAGIPAHGVPFTSAVDDDGLLSRGLDPPATQAPAAGPATSWRGWVTDRLASALIVARDAPCRACEPSQFALHRLELAGVDVATWWPAGVAEWAWRAP